VCACVRRNLRRSNGLELTATAGRNDCSELASCLDRAASDPDCLPGWQRATSRLGTKRHAGGNAGVGLRARKGPAACLGRIDGEDDGRSEAFSGETSLSLICTAMSGH